MTFKLPLCVVVVDILLYLMLFHSGIVLPIVNPSIEEYKTFETSVPRDFMQQLIWAALHSPTSFVIVEYLLGPKFMFLSVLQPALICVGIGSYLDYRKRNGKPIRFSLRLLLAIVAVVAVLCFVFQLSLK